nr:hypothetical protein [Tanacetum cinerariifolium]
EKKAKLFNEWEKFTSTDGESIESYYHRNQFGQHAGQVTLNQQGYNAWQNDGIQGLRVLELGIKPGATTIEDWVILLGIALPDQEEWKMLIFRLSCSLLKRKKQGFNYKQKNLTSWLMQAIWMR